MKLLAKDKRFIAMLKEKGVKSKDIKTVLHSFYTLNIIAFNSHTDIKQIYAMYEMSLYP